jgi:hypothetical protein
LSEHNLKVEHPPLAVRRDWYSFGDDGTFRATGKKVSTEYGTGTDVQVRIWVIDHHKPLKANKAYLLAVAVHGWPSYWQCPDCDERVYDVVKHLNGHRYDTSPGNLKWTEDTAGRAWHESQCIENMLDRRETEPGYANDPPGRRSFMTAAACFIADNAYEEDDIPTGLPRMFHSVTPAQDKVLNDPDKLSPTSNQPRYFH